MNGDSFKTEQATERSNDPEYEEYVRKQLELARLRRERADQIARDKLHAQMVLVGAALLIIILIVAAIIRAGHKSEQAANTSSADKPFAHVEQTDKTEPKESETPEDASSGEQNVTEDTPYAGQAEGHTLVTENGITYVDGIMIVNKTFSLPSTYDPGLDPEAEQAFNDMAGTAWSEGITLWICSGYRSYDEQVSLFEGYVNMGGLDYADSVSARPGHSEHQSGLCMDINSTDFSFEYTAEAAWLAEHCAEYGFIIRFPRGKESITGYTYEPWHLRYVGVEAAQVMKAQDLCLEEYLGVTSDYADAPNNDEFIEKYGT